MRLSTQPLAGALVILASVLVTAPAAGAAGNDRCFPKQSRTVVETETARVFESSTKKARRFFGCLLTKKRPHLLFRVPRTPEAEEVRKPLLAGRFVAYQRLDYGRTGHPFELRVFNLRRGSVKVAAKYGDTVTFHIDSVVLNDRGSVAWTVTDTTFHSSPDMLDIKVYRWSGGKPELLDQTEGDAYKIDNGSLALDQFGDKLFWLASRRRPDGLMEAEPQFSTLP